MKLHKIKSLFIVNLSAFITIMRMGGFKIFKQANYLGIKTNNKPFQEQECYDKQNREKL